MWNSAQERSGALRGLLRRPSELLQTASECWNYLPRPRERYVARVAHYCGFRSRGQAVIVDLFRLMMREHRLYLENIPPFVYAMFREKYPNIAADDEYPGLDMAMDYREQMAEHLAADRAAARLLLAPMPNRPAPVLSGEHSGNGKRNQMFRVRTVSVVETGSCVSECGRVRRNAAGCGEEIMVKQTHRR